MTFVSIIPSIIVVGGIMLFALWLHFDMNDTERAIDESFRLSGVLASTQSFDKTGIAFIKDKNHSALLPEIRYSSSSFSKYDLS